MRSLGENIYMQTKQIVLICMIQDTDNQKFDSKSWKSVIQDEKTPMCLKTHLKTWWTNQNQNTNHNENHDAKTTGQHIKLFWFDKK